MTPEPLAGFREWLLREQGTSEGTVRKYMYYLPRLQGASLCGKQDVSLAFEKMRLTKVSYEAFSRFLTYLEKKTAYEELALSLRRALPRKPRSREDTFVPPDSEVRGLGECVVKHGEAYRLLYSIMVYSGGPVQRGPPAFKEQGEGASSPPALRGRQGPPSA